MEQTPSWALLTTLNYSSLWSSDIDKVQSKDLPEDRSGKVSGSQRNWSILWLLSRPQQVSSLQDNLSLHIWAQKTLQLVLYHCLWLSNGSSSQFWGAGDTNDANLHWIDKPYIMSSLCVCVPLSVSPSLFLTYTHMHFIPK